MTRLAYAHDEDERLQGSIEHLAFIVGQFAPKLHAALRDVKAITHSRATLDRATNDAFQHVVDYLHDAVVDACSVESRLGLDVGVNLSAEIRKAVQS